jgi:hypothetical protein
MLPVRIPLLRLAKGEAAMPTMMDGVKMRHL